MLVLYVFHIVSCGYKWHTSGVINFPVSKHTAGRVQYASRGIDVKG
jgi:hypothetical protein